MPPTKKTPFPGARAPRPPHEGGTPGPDFYTVVAAILRGIAPSDVREGDRLDAAKVVTLLITGRTPREVIETDETGFGLLHLSRMQTVAALLASTARPASAPMTLEQAVAEHDAMLRRPVDHDIHTALGAFLYDVEPDAVAPTQRAKVAHALEALAQGAPANLLGKDLGDVVPVRRMLALDALMAQPTVGTPDYPPLRTTTAGGLPLPPPAFAHLPPKLRITMQVNMESPVALAGAAVDAWLTAATPTPVRLTYSALADLVQHVAEAISAERSRFRVALDAAVEKGPET